MASSPVAPAPPRHPFDAVAGEYDASFTSRPLGRWYRRMVWHHLERAFTPGQHVLELGCGTGEDAVWLAGRGVSVTATDASTAMLDVTRRKVADAGVVDLVNVARLDLTALDAEAIGSGANRVLERQYDGAFASFGPLNCVPDRRVLAGALARLVRPGGRLVLVVMGPVCPWEIVWHLGRGRVRTAVRRFRAGAPARVGDGESLRVWYPSCGRLQDELAPAFRTLEVAGLGLLLPTSEMSRLVERAPRLFRAIARLDRQFARTLPWRWLNDHYLIVLERE